MNFRFWCEPRYINRSLVRYLTISTLSTLALMVGLAPNISPRLGEKTLSSIAQAQAQQEFTSDEIQSYARAVLGMEPRRQTAYDEIRQIIGDNVPVVVCHQTRTINGLEQDVRAIAVNYCSQAKVIIESNALTISRFNEITLAQQSDPQLKQQIQDELRRELLRSQQNSGN